MKTLHDQRPPGLGEIVDAAGKNLIDDVVDALEARDWRFCGQWLLWSNLELRQQLITLSEEPDAYVRGIGIVLFGDAGQVAELDEVTAAVERIPKDVTINVNIRTSGDLQSAGGGAIPPGTYQTGTPRVPRTGMYILHGDEAVLTQKEAAAYRLGIQQGMNISNTNNYTMNVHTRATVPSVIQDFKTMRMMEGN